jgi:acetylglutamate kinase
MWKNNEMDEVVAKAAGMIEALPFIQRFRNETVVVKFGGSMLDDEEACRSILQDIAFMEVVGLRPVVVHGGGKAISRRMEEVRLTPRFVHGLRVTDEETMGLVEEALHQEVNPHLVEIISSFGCRAQGIHGNDIVRVVRKITTDPDTGDPMDLGYVGEAQDVDTAPIRASLDAQTVPVVTPLGRGEDGHTYNVNADETAASMARALRARKLVYLSDVPGLLEDPGDPSTLISHVEAEDVEELIGRGIIQGGMIPKMRSAVKTLGAGVSKVHIIDSALRHSLLMELFTERGVGTEIVRS